MSLHTIELPGHHQIILDRFVAACLADRRVVAAFLGGSYATGAVDAHSDLDLGLIAADAAYEDLLAGRAAFVRQLGEPLLLEDFGYPNMVFFILADGAEAELAIGRESEFTDIHGGPYRVLLDKKGILEGAVFPWAEPDQAEQTETLRRLIYWFWHEMSHFVAAIGRGQLWWAYGQLEALRRYGVNLARLSQNFSDAGVGSEAYFKVEKALPGEQLAPLRATCCPLEQAAMLQAAHIIVRFYRELAAPLALAHGIAYPDALDRVMSNRLERVSDSGSA